MADNDRILELQEKIIDLQKLLMVRNFDLITCSEELMAAQKTLAERERSAAAMMEDRAYTDADIRNIVTRLRFIDEPEFTEAVGSPVQWPAFRDDPHGMFLKLSTQAQKAIAKTISTKE